MRGVEGFGAKHRLRTDRLLTLSEDLPLVSAVVETPPAVRRWFEIIDECTEATGLVTSELVPAFHARGPGIEAGGLRLAAGWGHGAR
jgi:PII-like signaling protein